MTLEASRRPAMTSVLRTAAAVLLVAAGVTGQDLGESAPGEDLAGSTVGEVRFSHSLHADELGFECSECHHETNAARLVMPHDEYLEDFWIDCRVCHRETDLPAAPQSCGDCHHDSPTTTADETLSAKVVIHRSCWNCHESGTGEEASQSCGFCHAGWLSSEETGR